MVGLGFDFFKFVKMPGVPLMWVSIWNPTVHILCDILWETKIDCTAVIVDSNSVSLLLCQRLGGICSIQWCYAFNWFNHLNFMPKNVIQWMRNSMEIKKCNWDLEFIDFCSVSSPFSFKYQDNSLALNYLSFLELNSVTWWMFWISKPWVWGTWEKHWFINSCPKKS